MVPAGEGTGGGFSVFEGCWYLKNNKKKKKVNITFWFDCCCSASITGIPSLMVKGCAAECIQAWMCVYPGGKLCIYLCQGREFFLGQREEIVTWQVITGDVKQQRGGTKRVGKNNCINWIKVLPNKWCKDNHKALQSRFVRIWNENPCWLLRLSPSIWQGMSQRGRISC